MFLLTNSLETKPKFCVNCRYFISNNDGSEYGKCSQFPIENTKYLINGIVAETEYYSCNTARTWESLCGKDAKEYKKKYRKRSLD
jgi:hypothetical protein